MRTSKRKQLVMRRTQGTRGEEVGGKQGEKGEEEGKRQGRGHCEGNQAQSGRKESRRGLKEKRGIARKKEQANYQKTKPGPRREWAEEESRSRQSCTRVERVKRCVSRCGRE